MPWFLLVLLLLIIGLLTGTNPSDAFQLVAPLKDAQLDTPLSVTLTWETCPGAASYRVELRSADKARARLAFESLTEPRLRLALCPDTTYEWRVWAITPTGEISSENEGRFTTADTKPEEVTDFVVMFAGVPPGEGYWEGLPRIPTDPHAELSPWFYKKSYDAVPPPSFESIREKLPQPIWDGHPDELRMYWYAWEILFSPLWLFPPKEVNHRAVSNLLGHYTWAGFGSTMVWDSAFILQFARYADHAYPVVTALDNCYARQHENGFICRESNASNIETWVIWPANPPLLPWSEWSVYQVSGDEERLRQVFLPLVKNYEWYMRYQRRADGLYWTRGEQEADDSPRNALMHSAVSTTAIQAMSAEQLAEMARIVGRPDLAAWFAAEAANLRQLVNDRFWDAEHSLYNDLGPDGKPVTVTEKGGVCKHGHIFWPLLAGCTDHKRGLAMARAAMDPAGFNRPSGIGSLSADSDGYNPETGAYWRGSVWPPIQCMVIKGLERAGFQGTADLAAEKYYRNFLEAYLAQGDITEFLIPEKPVMAGVPHFVGWGGVAPIELLFENLFGLRVDAPARTIRWRIRQRERHGVEQLPLGQDEVGLVCEARAEPASPAELTITSTGRFTLTVELPGGVWQREIEPGQTLWLVENR